MALEMTRTALEFDDTPQIRKREARLKARSQKLTSTRRQVPLLSTNS